MSYAKALKDARNYVKAHTHDFPSASETEQDIALWAIETAADFIDTQHFYSLTEIRKGTGFPKGVRFIMVEPER